MAQKSCIPFEVNCFISFTCDLVCMSRRIDDTCIISRSQWQLLNWTVYKKLYTCGLTKNISTDFYNSTDCASYFDEQIVTHHTLLYIKKF